MILFPWLARVFDRYDGRSAAMPTQIQSNTHEIRPKSVTYYQALIDTRDIPFIRAHTG